MAITLKDIIRLLTPPVFIHLVKRPRGKRPTDTYGLSGDYQSWDEAMAASTGYASEIILEKTRTALLKVKNGEAVYERDSVLFDEIQYSWPPLACLMWAAARSGGKLNVLDFGGSLGTTYFQNRVFLSRLPGVRWNIVEQARHVEAGKTWFEDDRLRFYASIEDCLADTQPNVILLGGVLQYLPRPYDLFSDLQSLPSDHILIDRTPFWEGPSDRLCVQTVPPGIYPASYPSWIFSATQFRSHLDKEWEVLEEFEGIDRLHAPIKVVSKGLLLVRRPRHGDRHPDGV
jgi:putative methyltransferase (TIGR04325 family)